MLALFWERLRNDLRCQGRRTETTPDQRSHPRIGNISKSNYFHRCIWKQTQKLCGSLQGQCLYKLYQFQFYWMFTWVNTPNKSTEHHYALQRSIPVRSSHRLAAFCDGCDVWCAVPLQVGSRRTPPALPSMVSTRDRAWRFGAETCPVPVPRKGWDQ